MIWFSSDHTGGPPDSEARVADNDLATGEMVDTISHSKYWKELRDLRRRGRQPGRRRPRRRAPRPGPGHQPVGGARQGDQHLLLADQHGPHHRADPRRPAAEREGRRGDADVRRIHLKPNYTPFNAVPNQIPLTEGIFTAPACGLDTLGKTGAAARALDKAGGSGDRGARGREGHRRCLAEPGSPASTPPATVRSPTTPTRSR